MVIGRLVAMVINELIAMIYVDCCYGSHYRLVAIMVLVTCIALT